jgi:LL-diaminopimelate aminotransferase
MMTEYARGWMSQRLHGLPKNEFRELTNLKAKIRAEGTEIIDLSEGLPDIPPHERLLAFMGRVVINPALSKYPTRWGMRSLTDQIEQFLLEQFNVIPGKWAVIPVAGSKEAFAHIAQSVLNPGDIALSPAPGYPIYEVAVSYAGAETVRYRLSDEGCPQLDQLSPTELGAARLLFLTSPNNPTGLVVPHAGILDALSVCARHDVILCQDMAYANLTGENHPATSLLSIADADKPVLEVHSLSKSLSVPGWRFGFVAGNRQLIENLELSKAVFDTGLFPVVQKTARYALANFTELNAPVRETYRRRMQIAARLLNDYGIETNSNAAGFFQWIKVNDQQGSGTAFTKKLLLRHNILIMPGASFHASEDKHVRISLTAHEAMIEKVFPTIGALLSEFRKNA